MKIQPRNPNFKARVEEKFTKNHLSHLIGIELTNIEAGEVHAKVAIRPEVAQQDNIAHGGLTLTIADVVSGFAAYSIIGEEQRVVTAELKNSFFRPGKGQELVAIGKVVKPGKSMIFCEAEVFAVDQDIKTLIARATSIMAVI